MTADIAWTFREESGRAVATLIRTFGDIDVAEDAVQEAFAIAIDKWPESGWPPNPGAWIVTTARNRAIDRLRREATRHDRQVQAHSLRPPSEPPAEVGPVTDDRLRLIFTCCHPALASSSQVALTLRLLGGLQTEEIARAFLVPEATMAQRLVRAKKKISAAKIPYRVSRRRRATRPARRRAGRRLPRLQRGLLGDERRLAGACRPQRRGDPPRPAGRRADARRGRGASACSPCSCSASRVAAGAGRRRRIARPACRPGPQSVGSRADRRGSGPRAGVPAAQHARAVPDPGGDQRRAQRRADGRRTPTGARSSPSTTNSSPSSPTPVVALNRAVVVAEVDGAAGRPGRRRRPRRRPRPLPALSRAPGPICCGASIAGPRPPTPTPRRSL